MRGKVKQDGSTLCRCRITPAYAGKRLRRQAPRCQSEDHPRLCGEKQTVTNLLMANIGSPPPMRGKAFWGIHVVIRQGITPAYAGKSYSTLGFQPFVRITPAYAGKRDSVKL